MADKFIGYDHKVSHHMRLTFIRGVARLYIDDYETTYAVRIPDAAVGEFAALMTNGNAAWFDNFAVTKLPDNATEGINIDSDEVSIVAKEKAHTVTAAENGRTDSLKIIIAVSAALASVGLLAVNGLILFKLKKRERK